MPRDALLITSAVLFVGVAVAATVTQQFGPITHPDARERIEAVNTAIDTLPYLHDGLVAVDSEPMEPAIRMLRPERLIQRTFKDGESGDEFGIVIVFSPDARDLAGHHPPVCYPNAGWTQMGVAPVSIPTGGREVEAMSYRFARTTDGLGGAAHLTATSFFIVPGIDRPFQSRMQAVEAAARDRRAAGLGAVHVMVLITGELSDAERDRLLGRAGDVLSATIKRIAP